MQAFTLFFTMLVALMLVGCTPDSGTAPKNNNKHEHEHEQGPHGGQLLEVGKEIAHVELLHDAKAGKMTVYVLGKDGKTPESIADVPVLNVRHKDAQKQIKMTAVNPTANKSAQFEATDAILREEVTGRIGIVIYGGQYNLELEHHHDH